MKLSRIYTNQPKLFDPIDFNGVTDERLNVVFAKITKTVLCSHFVSAVGGSI